MPARPAVDPANKKRDERLGRTIRDIRNQRGWTTLKLAMQAGLDQSFISKLENARTGYSYESLVKIAGALGVSIERLQSSQSNVSAATPDFRQVIVLDHVQAGSWRTVQSRQDPDQQETAPINLDYPPSVFFLRIKGDSMAPVFIEGDLVLIAPTVSPRPGDYVVATDATGEATFKQYRDLGLNESGHHVFELVPLNPIYAPMRSDRQELAIVGTMLEHRRFRRS